MFYRFFLRLLVLCTHETADERMNGSIKGICNKILEKFYSLETLYRTSTYSDAQCSCFIIITLIDAIKNQHFQWLSHESRLWKRAPAACINQVFFEGVKGVRWKRDLLAMRYWKIGRVSKSVKSEDRSMDRIQKTYKNPSETH